MENGSMNRNPLRELAALGQSVWLDDIRRRWLVDGTLARLIEQDGISGLTSNPAIFERSISRDTDYDDAIAAGRRVRLGGERLYETLVIDDIRAAADLLHTAYHASGARDGYVSLEVSPHIAHDTAATIDEAQRLWSRVARPNLMVKVPGTEAGLPAIRTLVGQGINVNVTLLFSVAPYRAVAQAYMTGVEEALRSGIIPGTSVASFFISRIDALVDARLDRLDAPGAQALRGRAATAAACLAYAEHKRLYAQPRWTALAERRAEPQRLLWASTSTKDDRYSDVKYLDELGAAGTVTTVPIETLAAYRDHGRPALRIEQNLTEAERDAGELTRFGLELDAIGAELQEDGVRKFAKSYDQLLAALERRSRGTKAATA
jgi:transaldolase